MLAEGVQEEESPFRRVGGDEGSSSCRTERSPRCLPGCVLSNSVRLPRGQRVEEREGVC